MGDDRLLFTAASPMRASFLILLVCVLQGCTALGAGFAADLNRQHRADARVDLAADSLLAPGDSLVLHVADGREVRGTFVALEPDSVRLDGGAFARSDVSRAERPWTLASVRQGAGVGAGLDVALVLFLVFGVVGYSIGGGW